MANVTRARFQGGKVPATPISITIHQKYENHTLAFFDYGLIDKADYVLPTEGAPVEATWGDPISGSKTFYGYVNHHETLRENRRPITRIVALGTSRVMNSVSMSMWLDTSRSAIVREIAKRYRLRSFIHPHNTPVEHWTTGPRTDWQALQALASETGYRLWVDGATVSFTDPRKVLRHAAWPVDYPSRAIFDWKVVGGSAVPGLSEAAKKNVLAGVDATGQVFEASSGDRGMPVSLVPTPAPTYSAAVSLVEAAAARQTPYFIARAMLAGNTKVYPGALVNLESATYTRERGGVWLVTEAEHTIAPNSFTTAVTLERGEDQLPVTKSLSTVRGVEPFDTAVLRSDNRWAAQRQDHVNV